MSTPGTDSHLLEGLANDLVERTRHAGGMSALVLSADGLVMARSHSLGREDAEHLAASAAGINSLASGTARQFQGGGLRQTIVEMEHRFMVLVGAAQGACLVMLTEQDPDIGLVAYEMNRLVEQIGRVMTAPPRAATQAGR